MEHIEILVQNKPPQVCVCVYLNCIKLKSIGILCLLLSPVLHFVLENQLLVTPAQNKHAMNTNRLSIDIRRIFDEQKEKVTIASLVTFITDYFKHIEL